VSQRRVHVERFVPLEEVRDRRISEILVHLHQRPHLRPADLAPIVGLGPSRLRHLFKEEVGLNIGRYAKHLQLQRAADLLATTHRSVKEIRHEIGIADAPNFTRHFKAMVWHVPVAIPLDAQKPF
jgi:AraC-like DNA-binding protein